MRNASPALIAFLNSATQFYVADLLTILPVNGSPIYITSAPIPITATSQVDNASHTWSPGGGTGGLPTFARSSVKFIVGLQVDAMSLTFGTISGQTLAGLPWPQQALNGYFDGAQVVLERCYMETFGDTSKGTLIDFWGIVGDVTPSRTTISMQVNAYLVFMQLPLPRNTYGPMCSHNLYDAGCGLSAASFTDSGAIAFASTTTDLFTDLTSVVPGYYELGVITFTSGANAGISRSVKVYGVGTVVVAPPLPVAPTIGDTFDIYPGCDKVIALAGDVTAGTCKVKFNNLVHARGFPFIPMPESAR